MAKAKKHPIISRRALLAAAAPAVLVAAAAPVAEQGDEKLFALLARRDELLARMRAAPDDNSADDEFDRLSELEREITAVPAMTSAGARAKLDLFEAEYRDNNTDQGEPIDLLGALCLSVLFDVRRHLPIS